VQANPEEVKEAQEPVKGDGARPGYDPKRQEFVMMYVIHKVKWILILFKNGNFD
jgi:hypothetical protein